MAGFKLIHHRHSGNLQPNHRSSFGHLAILLALVGMVMGFASPIVRADQETPTVFENPTTGFISVGAVVSGPPPNRAAVILEPRNGSALNNSPVTVSGTCISGTFVSLYDNGVFAGATSCSDEGTFSLLSDLFPGRNVLIARISDVLSQFGPDSAPITITYNPPVTPNTSTDITQQLLISADDPIILGVAIGQDLARTIRISGGQGPYAILWDFGDGETSSVPQSLAGTNIQKHVYAKPGRYRVIVKVTDITGNASLLELVTVVNGEVTGVGSKKGIDIPGILLGVWPLYTIAVLSVLIFWLGERRELYVLRRSNRLMAAR